MVLTLEPDLQMFAVHSKLSRCARTNAQPAVQTRPPDKIDGVSSIDFKQLGRRFWRVGPVPSPQAVLRMGVQTGSADV